MVGEWAQASKLFARHEIWYLGILDASTYGFMVCDGYSLPIGIASWLHILLYWVCMYEFAQLRISFDDRNY